MGVCVCVCVCVCVKGRKRQRLMRVPGLQHARKRNEAKAGARETDGARPSRTDEERGREKVVVKWEEERERERERERDGERDSVTAKESAYIGGRGMQLLCPSTSLKPDPGLRIPSRLPVVAAPLRHPRHPRHPPAAPVYRPRSTRSTIVSSSAT